MQAKHSIVILILSVLAALSACREPNEYHCPEGDLCVLPPQACGDITCEAPTPVCKSAGTETCVACTANEHCPRNSLPFCDTTVNECVECLVNADCDSELCVDQKCVAPEDVVYVTEDGDDARDCSKAAPCAKLDRALKLNPKYIKATGRLDDPMMGAKIDRSVTIFGVPGGTTLVRSMAGPVVEVTKTATVLSMLDLEIVGDAPGGAGNGMDIKDGATVKLTRVNARKNTLLGIFVEKGTLVMRDSNVFENTGIGVVVKDGSLESTNSTFYKNTGVAAIQTQTNGTLTMKDSKVYQNAIGVQVMGGTATIDHSWIYSNTGSAGIVSINPSILTIRSSVLSGNTGLNGALDVAGVFTIKNNIISANGNNLMTTYGIRLNSSSGTFEFNTVADNSTGGTPDLGVSCGLPFTISNNIIVGNITNGCTNTFSLMDIQDSNMSNITGNPMFTDMGNDPLNPAFYRIRAGSVAKDKANPASTEMSDIDGEPRSDGKPDMGADEYN